MSPEIQNHNAPVDSGGEIFHCTPGITFGVPALIPATTFLPHPGNINAPVPEGFYKHWCWCILQALGPSNIVVFSYPLLCHRQYMACGRCSVSMLITSAIRTPNHRKWYFAAQLDLNDAIGQTQNPGLNQLKSKRSAKRPSHEKSLSTALDHWREAMHNMSQHNRLRQIALYLPCWVKPPRSDSPLNASASSSTARTTTIDPLNARIMLSRSPRACICRRSRSRFTDLSVIRDMNWLMGKS